MAEKTAGFSPDADKSELAQSAASDPKLLEQVIDALEINLALRTRDGAPTTGGFNGGPRARGGPMRRAE